jgi:hypothetical protein
MFRKSDKTRQTIRDGTTIGVLVTTIRMVPEARPIGSRRRSRGKWGAIMYSFEARKVRGRVIHVDNVHAAQGEHTGSLWMDD